MANWSVEPPPVQDPKPDGKPHPDDEGPATADSIPAAVDTCTQDTPYPQPTNISPTTSGSTEPSIQRGKTLLDHSPDCGCCKNLRGIGTPVEYSPTGFTFTTKIPDDSASDKLNTITCDQNNCGSSTPNHHHHYYMVYHFHTCPNHTRTSYQRALIQHFSPDSNGFGRVEGGIVQIAPLAATGLTNTGRLVEFRENPPRKFTFNLTRVSKALFLLRRQIELLAITVGIANFFWKVLSITSICE